MASPAQQLRERLIAGAQLTLDAGTGTELEARGVPMHPTAWCAVAHMTDPEACITLHQDYVRAGADIITANTFSSSRNMMGPAGLGDEAATTTRRAVELACEARDRMELDRPVVVAGSMSHQVPIRGHHGGADLESYSERDPEHFPDEAQARANFDEHAHALAEGGADMILMEMMSAPDLAVPAIESAVATGLPVWIGLSARYSDDGTLVSNALPNLSFEEVAQPILEAGGEVAGIMHSPVNSVLPATEIIRRYFDGPLMAYPDSGHFTMPHWNFEEVIEPVDFADATRSWREHGIQVVGGCCGLGVAHIHAMPTPA